MPPRVSRPPKRPEDVVEGQDTPPAETAAAPAAEAEVPAADAKALAAERKPIEAEIRRARRAAKEDKKPYVAETKAIKVSVKPTFLEDQSSPGDDHYVWAYHVRIENHGPETVQLRNRYWRITDSMGRVQEVRGAGVVGEQPVLKPGESFEYTSGTRLRTPTGTMHGSYFFVAEDGERFDVDIPMFVLDALSSSGAAGGSRTLH